MSRRREPGGASGAASALGSRWVVAAWAVLWAMPGCGGVSLPVFSSSSSAAPLEAEYRIHPDDDLEVNVWGQADLNRTVHVREDGTCSFPFIGEVVAQQRTLREMEQAIADRLAQGYLQNPHVSVKLVSPRFSILGEVEKPGTYPIEGRVDLLAAISMAGGVNKFGSSRLEVIRVLADGQKLSHVVDLNAVLAGRRPTILLHPHDTIHVRRRLF